MPGFVHQALSERKTAQDLWLGFVGDNPRLTELAGRDVSEYLVLMPSDAPRHAKRNHGHDGGDQRALEPQDYSSAARWIDEGLLSKGDDGPKGLPRIKSVYTAAGGERIVSIWELRPGKRNRALSLISAWVKM